MHITRDQVAAAVAYAVFVMGLVLLVVASANGDRPRMADIGAGVALAGLPFVILARVRRQHHMTAEDKEAIRREGYRLGLDHAARGLLIPRRSRATARAPPPAPRPCTACTQYRRPTTGLRNITEGNARHVEHHRHRHRHRGVDRIPARVHLARGQDFP